MNHIEASYQVKGQSSYLVISPGEGEVIIDYLAKMVEYNRIPGLLPVFSQTIDGRTRFNYEITGRSRMTDLAGTTRITTKQGEKLLTSLVDGFMNLNRYFLNISQCILEEEYLFVDEAFQTYLPYYPAEDNGIRDINKMLSEFFLRLLGSCFMTADRNDYYDGLMRFLIRPNFDLKRFRDLVVTDKAPGIEKGITTAFDGGRGEIEKTLDQEKIKAISQEKGSRPGEVSVKSAAAVKAPTAGGGTAIPGGSTAATGGGIAIPGGGTAVVKPVKEKKVKVKKEKVKEEKIRTEKTGKGLFGLSFKKKNELGLNMNEEAHVIPAGNEQIGTGQQPGMQPSLTVGQSEWKGTVQLANDDGATVMMEGSSSGGKAYLVYGGNYVEISASPFKIGKISSHLIISKETISRNHASVTVINGSYFIKDENSKNRTYVNGQMLPPYSPVELEDGDVIRLANEELVFSKGS